MTKENEFKGFSLFNDIDDAVLRTRNRAVILANISESHMKKGKISPGGAALTVGYYNAIPENERTPLLEKFKDVMGERGYALG